MRIPRRPYSWLDDPPRRGRIEGPARRAYSDMRYRRCQMRTGPVHSYEVVLDVPGRESRRVLVEFDHRFPSTPEIYADGPTDSPHRFGDRDRTRLCVWYPGDPDDRVWVPDDGLLVLFGMIAVHLMKEAWWRENDEWLGEEAPHGVMKDDGERLPA